MRNKYIDVIFDSNPHKKFIIFHKETCHVCTETFSLLNNKGFEFRSFPINNDPNSKNEVFESLSSYIGTHRTFPIIFYDGKFIGGLKELKIFISSL